MVAPKPGGMVEPSLAGAHEVLRWWPDVPWQTVEEVPVWSTGTAELMRADAVVETPRPPP